MINYKKRTLLSMLALSFLFAILLLPLEINVQLDDHIRLIEGEEHSLSLRFPLDLYIRADEEGILDINGRPVRNDGFNLFDYTDGISLTGLSRGNVNLELSLWKGLIPLRNLSVSVLPQLEFVAGGHSIGIKLHSDGVVVVGYYYLENKGTPFSPARDAGIETGDILIDVNGIILKNMDSAVEVIQRQAAKGEMNFTVHRNGGRFNLPVLPYYCLKVKDYFIGLYIRDTAAGVGTLTFYHPGNNSYGALGHVITDMDTNKPVEISEGQIVRADIVNIKMARRGQPGEKAGIFREGKDILGTIEKNTYYGIYGRLQKVGDYLTPYPHPIPLGLSFQVESGPAEVLTVIEGNQIQSFRIEVEKVMSQSTPGDKGMIIRITDENLLEVTGGIVQGMSGSPIIQNGRLVGAITHVFVNDPTKGYGIFAEWMAKEVGLISHN